MATTVSTATLAPADLDRLAERYVVREGEAVAGFIREYPEVVAPLLEAVAVVPQFFGPGRTMVLELDRDRDGTGPPQLFALIQTDQDADASLASLDRFDRAWGLDALQRANRRLVFSLEPV